MEAKLVELYKNLKTHLDRMFSLKKELPKLGIINSSKLGDLKILTLKKNYGNMISILGDDNLPGPSKGRGQKQSNFF